MCLLSLCPGDSHILDGSLSDPMSTMKKQIRAGQEVCPLLCCADGLYCCGIEWMG